MAILTKEALLGASDLEEREVELPSIGGSVRVRSLPAASSNQAISEALVTMTGRRGEQTSRIDTAKLEVIQVLHALVEPKLNSLAEAEQLAERLGPAWRELVRVIDELSGVSKEELEKAETMFQVGGPTPPRAGVGNGSSAGSE